LSGGESNRDLSHPHTCTLHDVGEHGGSMFLVMEHPEGQTLGDRIRKGPLPIEQTFIPRTNRGGTVCHASGGHHSSRFENCQGAADESGVKSLDFTFAN
jgi:serine/threonine protein kinase